MAGRVDHLRFRDALPLVIISNQKGFKPPNVMCTYRKKKKYMIENIIYSNLE